MLIGYCYTDTPVCTAALVCCPRTYTCPTFLCRPAYTFASEYDYSEQTNSHGWGEAWQVSSGAWRCFHLLVHMQQCNCAKCYERHKATATRCCTGSLICHRSSSIPELRFNAGVKETIRHIFYISRIRSTFEKPNNYAYFVTSISKNKNTFILILQYGS